jgi:hypothetical protein
VTARAADDVVEVRGICHRSSERRGRLLVGTSEASKRRDIIVIRGGTPAAGTRGLDTTKDIDNGTRLGIHPRDPKGIPLIRGLVFKLNE